MNLRQFRRAFRHEAVRGPLLLIYQMGKVGSQTIEASLRNAAVPHQIFRPHILSPHNIGILAARLGNKTMPEQAKESLRRQLDEATRLYSLVVARRWKRRFGSDIPKLQIIAGVREPVGLMLASIFQNHTAYFADLNSITAEGVRELFLHDPKVLEERRRYMTEGMAYINNWFDDELKTVAGIDVYATPFPHDRGYAIYENRHVRALVYRFENLDGLKPMLEEFLGIELPLLISRNIGEEKAYADVYRTVKESLRLPADYLQRQYETKMVRHFYTGREREQLIGQWSAGQRARFGKLSASVTEATPASPAEKPGIEVFLTRAAFSINEARLSHLASLGLDLHGKRVLEVGGGIGLHTCFFESLGCDVLFTDARPENIAEVQRRYPHRRTAVLNLDTDHDLQRFGEFDVVYCYGTLYHLSRPAEALQALAKVCRGLILLETCVTPGEHEAVNLEEEWAANPNQAFSGLGCRPTRPWVMRVLREEFGHAYSTVAQPNFPDFETNWAAPAQRKLYRAIFVGSRLPLTHPALTATLLAETPTLNGRWQQACIELGSVQPARDVVGMLPAPGQLQDYRKITLRVGGLQHTHVENPGRRPLVQHMAGQGFVLVSEQPGPVSNTEDLVFFKYGP